MIRLTLSVMLLWMLFPATLTAGCGDKPDISDPEINEFQSKIPSALMLPLSDTPLCEGSDTSNSAASLICSLIPVSDSGCLTQAKALLQTDRHTGTSQINGLQQVSISFFGPDQQHSVSAAYVSAPSGKNPPGSPLLRAPPFSG